MRAMVEGANIVRQELMRDKPDPIAGDSHALRH
jgi:hypothetical protein